MPLAYLSMTDTMGGFADFSFVDFENVQLLRSDRFRVDTRVFGDEGRLLLDVERESLEIRRHDGQPRRGDVPRGDGVYSCDEPPHRVVDLVSGRGVEDSPGDVAVCSVELIEARHSPANARGAAVTVYRGEGSEGDRGERRTSHVDDIDD